MILNVISVTHIPGTVLKHSTKGNHLNKFEYRAYIDDSFYIKARLRLYF